MVKDWISAARPRTLPASASPVIAASAYAFYAGTFRWVPAVLCLLFALLAQVASNMANDYFDYVKGSDKAGRVGPRRAVASGDITPRSMLMGTFCVLGVACAVGLGLVFFAGWQLIPIGVIIAVFALAYTAGPYPLAYHGLGDVTVFLFFGLVAVNMTYYVQALQFDADVFLLSIAMGLLSINILLVNNYRDMEEDAAANDGGAVRAAFCFVVVFCERAGSRFVAFSLFGRFRNRVYIFTSHCISVSSYKDRVGD